MLVYDAMQNEKTRDGRMFSEVYRPVIVFARMINSTQVMLMNNGSVIEYSNFIDFSRERNKTIYYSD